ncbi:hypothetical protein EV714DRAFT_245862, partial [Schizophyllum commune]
CGPQEGHDARRSPSWLRVPITFFSTSTFPIPPPMSVPLPDSVSPIKCLVIGASFEGLIVAYLLQQAGHQVVVVDKGDADRQ